MHAPPRRASLLLVAVVLAVGLLLPTAAPATSAPAPAPVPAPGAGAAGVGDPLFPRAGNGGYQVDHYDLALRYNPDSQLLRATATLTATTRRALSSFHLDFYGLRVDAVEVDGVEATWRRRGAQLPDPDGWQELIVTPVAPLANGAAFTVEVRYHGRPRTYIDPDFAVDGWVTTDDGAVVANEPVGAMTVFPCNNHPSDKATYDVAITVPEGLTGVSNGRLRSRTTVDGWTTWDWHAPDPMATYLMTATIGEFRQVKQVGPGGVQVRSFVDPAMTGGIAAAKRVPEVLTGLVDLYGDYPFVSAGVIIDNASLGYALEVQTRPVFDNVPGTTLLVHELGHQWFGDAVSPSTWQHIWLNEGFATYTEWLWDERTSPGAAEQRFQGEYARSPGDSLWMPPPADPGDGEHLFGDPVYTRGAMALHVLRRQLGKATFLQVAREWVETYGGGDADTGDLLALAEEVSGQQLDVPYDDWVWENGRPAGYRHGGT